MKKITVIMIALCIALVSGATLAKSSRVDVLHKPGTAAERTITISVSALPAHCRHGDYVLGDPLGCVIDDGDGDSDEVITVCHWNYGDAFMPENVPISNLAGYTDEHETHGHLLVDLGDCPDSNDEAE